MIFECHLYAGEDEDNGASTTAANMLSYINGGSPRVVNLKASFLSMMLKAAIISIPS